MAKFILQPQHPVFACAVRQDDSRIPRAKGLQADIGAFLESAGDIVIRRRLVHIADPDIAEELATLDVLVEDFPEIVFDLLHRLVVWRDTGPDESVRVRIPVKNVDAAVLNTL